MFKLFCTSLLLGVMTTPVMAQTNRNQGSMALSLAGIANARVKNVESEDRDNNTDLGAGALIEAKVNNRLGIETGVLLINRHYGYEKAGLRLTQEVRRVHVPVLARFWVANIFSVAAGPFVAFKTGDTETTVHAGNTALASYKTTADDSTEYGLDAAATLSFAVNETAGIFVEGRYSALLEKQSDEEADEISGLAGLKINL
ncbi:hypothetical protein COU14_00805 [Candidatus Kaiserbacteria bacterium CG10_big_fil_rev_8_21_14_0_10_44_10]|uniref:Outer membrane protein beta-barrel domain-containing protein n=1 Tax=Candidatus Kaiserbacteria bacterium CG10_big_fil_rev_8_21_14_0_10_44_10 TaxID=1974606 RepID=A0A2H0UI89_9BACT|nr:MAG: hypothetical protein COU14_00805 [Candidatus Kaiserbacteria bacterium CG10_big_fil_rev_8_21_14_0_10_44_10]